MRKKIMCFDSALLWKSDTIFLIWGRVALTYSNVILSIILFAAIFRIVPPLIRWFSTSVYGMALLFWSASPSTETLIQEYSDTAWQFFLAWSYIGVEWRSWDCRHPFPDSPPIYSSSWFPWNSVTMETMQHTVDPSLPWWLHQCCRFPVAIATPQAPDGGNSAVRVWKEEWIKEKESLQGCVYWSKKYAKRVIA